MVNDVRRASFLTVRLVVLRRSRYEGAEARRLQQLQRYSESRSERMER